MKLYLITSILFAISSTLMAINNELDYRMFLLIPTLILFYATVFIFTVEYDNQRSKSWKNKEKSLIENTYSKFVSEYHKEKN